MVSCLWESLRSSASLKTSVATLIFCRFGYGHCPKTSNQWTRFKRTYVYVILDIYAYLKFRLDFDQLFTLIIVHAFKLQNICTFLPCLRIHLRPWDTVNKLDEVQKNLDVKLPQTLQLRYFHLHVLYKCLCINISYLFVALSLYL